MIQYRKQRIKIVNVSSEEYDIKNKEYDEIIERINSDFRSIDTVIKEQVEDISSINDITSVDTKRVERLKSEVISLQWERREKELSIQTKIEKVLEKMVSPFKHTRV